MDRTAWIERNFGAQHMRLAAAIVRRMVAEGIDPPEVTSVAEASTRLLARQIERKFSRRLSDGERAR